MLDRNNVRTFRTRRHAPRRRLRPGCRVRIHSDVRYAWHPIVRGNNGTVGKLVSHDRDWSMVRLPGHDPVAVPSGCIRAL